MSLDVTLVDANNDYCYTANITHNLNKMADAAGIYKALWHPEELGFNWIPWVNWLFPPKAKHLIEPLKRGLEQLKAYPEKFSQYNAPNGWGTYKHFVPFVEKYLEACEAHPESIVHVSR